MRKRTMALVAAAGLAAPVGAAAQEMPALVAAYARQLAQQCGPLPPGVPAPALADRVDLNGDKLDDWIVDAGRYPCPGRPAVAAAAGAQVTVFKGVQGGIAVPALQRATFGSRLQRLPDGAPALWLTLAGSDCGATSPDERCERRVVWRTVEQRFDLVATPAKPAQ